MSNQKKILKIIYADIIIIQLLLLYGLFIQHPMPENTGDYISLYKNLSISIFVMYIIAIICYICEHKINNKNEYLFDDTIIEPKFDLSFEENDILYLSTILNQKLPGKKGIILLIMQLITKKVIDLSSYYDGNKYQYTITKRIHYTANITDTENTLLNYLFKTSNSVNLIERIKKLYRNKTISHLEEDVYQTSKLTTLFERSKIKTIYKIIATIIAILSFFLGVCLIPITKLDIYRSVKTIVFHITFIALICIFIAFLFTIILKKLNSRYQYNNDSISWILLNILFLNLCLIIAYLFPTPWIVQYFILVIYILTTLTIMIKYNVHLSLTKNEIILREKIIALKKFFTTMDYLKDKEFANTITYEECIMYGFLFGITIKINQEFDVLQKELIEVVTKEGKQYLKLFKETI